MILITGSPPLIVDFRSALLIDGLALLGNRKSKSEIGNLLFIVLLLFRSASQQHRADHRNQQKQRCDLKRQSRLPVKLFADFLGVLGDVQPGTGSRPFGAVRYHRGRWSAVGGSENPLRGIHREIE